MISLRAEVQSIADVSIDWPTFAETASVLMLRSGYNAALVVLGAGLLGVAAGCVGCFALLRKRALMGDALAHSALPGLALAFICAVFMGWPERNLIILLGGATISGVLGVFVVQLLSRYTRLSEDSAIGIVLSVFFGAGVVLLSIIQSMSTGSAGGLSHFIYGQTAAMSLHDAYLLAGTAGGVLLFTALLFKEFRVVCFDPDFAAVQGWPVTFIDLLLMALVTVVTVIGLQSVGMILIVALLVVPPAAARFWTEELSRMFVLSAVFGGASGYFGAAASALFPRLPAGAVIVLTAGFFFGVSFLFAPKRGVVAGLLRLMRVRILVLKDHLLRDIFEVSELRDLAEGEVLPLLSVPIVRGWGKLTRTLLLRGAAARGLISLSANGLALTAHGRREAERLTRNHRLWEQYLVEYAGVLSSHVDYSADYVEHVLSPEIVSRLEQRLETAPVKPAPAAVPPSLHPIGNGESSR